jgi:hypothetical protein
MSAISFTSSAVFGKLLPENNKQKKGTGHQPVLFNRRSQGRTAKIGNLDFPSGWRL